ncbi:MAG: SsrA-binding protein SmpB [Elusimicrobia bacterium]|nr:SsrA-binding protein SmpB [Elusimicrobiota bacterium]MDE2424739.1 SsrA-binding protein SmpB [Elusimicrobiota bacterium]
MKTKSDDKRVVATHRKARAIYEILETYEAGLSLLGSEVKSLRGGRASLDGCFGRLDGGQLSLFNFYIPPYQFATVSPPDPRRSRRLLMHRRELDRLSGRLQGKGLTLVPLEVYFRRGWAKVLLGLARGKKGPDRREDLKKRATAREAEKSFKGSYRS